MANNEATRGLADIDAMVGVGGMAHNPFVFLIESIHSRPRECDSTSFASIGRQFHVLPYAPFRSLLTHVDDVPGGAAKVGVPCCALAVLQHSWRDVSLREVGHRIPSRFE
jgi:hypothetical protein